MTAIVNGWDATSKNEPAAPPGQGGGYTTGTPDVRWTGEQWKRHPGAVRICQDAGATDTTADELDIETGAATGADVPGWTKAARDACRAGTRPGQRYPAVYVDLSNLPGVAAVTDTMPAGQRPHLHLAHWGIGMDAARALIGTVQSGLYVTGVQFASHDTYDSDCWLQAWLESVSVKPEPVTTPPPPDWEVTMLGKLPALKRGDKGAAVRTLQGLLVARHYHLGVTGAEHDGIDGDFGELTDAAVRELQGAHSLTADGICGPDTWPAAAGV
jgi:hypothetical protein